MLNNIIHYYTGQPLGRIKHDTDRDFFMSAEGPNSTASQTRCWRCSTS